MLHAGVVGFNVFKMNEFNEQLVETSFLKDDLDYIALGHYHDSYQVAKNAFYSGSIERFSFSEAHQKKGYMLIDLETGVRTFKELPTREMLDIGPVDASGMDPASLMGKIDDLLSRDLDGRSVMYCDSKRPTTGVRNDRFPSFEGTDLFHRAFRAEVRYLPGQCIDPDRKCYPELLGARVRLICETIPRRGC